MSQHDACKGQEASACFGMPPRGSSSDEGLSRSSSATLTPGSSPEPPSGGVSPPQPTPQPSGTAAPHANRAVGTAAVPPPLPTGMDIARDARRGLPAARGRGDLRAVALAHLDFVAIVLFFFGIWPILLCLAMFVTVKGDSSGVISYYMSVFEIIFLFDGFYLLVRRCFTKTNNDGERRI